MRIDPIVPRPRRATLLAAAADFTPQVRWQYAAEGVEWESLAEQASGTWPRSTGGSSSKTEARRVNGASALANGSALPFTVYVHEGADFDVSDQERYVRFARAGLAAVLPDQIESVFWTGNVNGAAYQTGITDLGAGHILSGSGTNDIVPTLWALLNQIRVTSGIKGTLTIHSPEAAFAAVKSLNLIERENTPAGPVWMFNEHPWVFGAGYTNVGPAATAATSGNVWIAVTGPVEVAVNPEVRVMPVTSSRLNQQRVLAEQDAFVRFDTASVWCAEAILPQSAP